MINENDLEAWEYYNEAYKDKMSMNEYQRMASKTAIYNSTHSILYPALGLAGEAGEVANKVKKIIRDGTFNRDAIADELGDCLWYIAALCRDLNVDMQTIADNNIKKLRDRQRRGKIAGSGDNR